MTSYDLTIPEKPSTKGVLIIPGANGKVLTEPVYHQLAQKLRESGYCVLRFNLWETAEALNDLILSDIYAGIEEAIACLKKEGCTTIGAVGKSFGGGILLARNHPTIKAMVLWAPAIFVSKTPRSEEFPEKKLKDVRPEDFTITKEELHKISTPTLIIQGTEDKIVRRGNSEAICSSIPHCSVELIDGAGHSYKKENELAEVINKTVTFLGGAIV